MLRLFRHIRQRLFLEGKVSRYFGYAVGEIVLIVVGIMIALQISEWNQERADAELEQLYLERLVVDVERDLNSLRNSRTENESRLEIIDLLIEGAKHPNRLLDRPVEWMSIMTYGPSPNEPASSADTYEELQSTGYLRLLSDPVKSILNEYYKSEERLQKSRPIRESSITEFFRLGKGILTNEQLVWFQKSVGRMINSSNQETLTSIDYNQNDLELSVIRFKENQDFLSWLPRCRQMITVTINGNQKRMEAALSLHSVLIEEFHGRDLYKAQHFHSE